MHSPAVHDILCTCTVYTVCWLMRGTVSLFWVGESVVPDYMYMCICVVHERSEGLSSTTNPKTHEENHPLLAQEHLIFFVQKAEKNAFKV